jgi:hypothetical protein
VVDAYIFPEDDLQAVDGDAHISLDGMAILTFVLSDGRRPGVHLTARAFERLGERMQRAVSRVPS